MTQPQMPESGRQSLSAWMVVGGIAMLAVVGAIAIGAVAVMFTAEPSPYPPGIAQATLDDGSVLVVRDVNIGSQQLEVTLPADSLWVRLGFDRPRRHTFHAHSRTDGMLVWFSRHDGQTGRPLPLDEWTHLSAHHAGSEVQSRDHATRLTRESPPHHASSSTGTNPPFSPLDPGAYSHILYAVGLPTLRPSGDTFTLELHNGSDLLAALDVPFPPALGPFPTWTAESLPVTQSDGPVDVTLTAVTEQWHQRDERRPRRQIRIKSIVREGGEISQLWNQRFELSDALGNQSYLYDCTFSSAESAWKVSGRLFRKDTAPFARDQMLIVEDIELPDTLAASKPNFVSPGESLEYDGVQVHLLGVGGPGKAEYHFPTSTSNSTHHTGDGIIAEYDSPTATLTIDNDKRHIVLLENGLTAGHSVELLLTDQNGLSIKPGYARSVDGARIWTFETDQWVSAVNAYIIIQRARIVEFFISPPQTEAAE